MTIVIYHFGIERDIPAFPFDKVEILHKIFKGGNLGVSYFYVFWALLCVIIITKIAAVWIRKSFG